MKKKTHLENDYPTEYFCMERVVSMLLTPIDTQLVSHYTTFVHYYTPDYMLWKGQWKEKKNSYNPPPPTICELWERFTIV